MSVKDVGVQVPLWTPNYPKNPGSTVGVLRRLSRFACERNVAAVRPHHHPISPTSGAISRARNAVFVVFAVNGFLFAAWAARIPDAKAQLGLSTGALGVVLLGLSFGSVISLPASGRVVDRIGSAAAVRLGAAVMTIGEIATGAAISSIHSALATMIGLVLTGLGMGLWDVSMNLQGAVVEQADGRTIMPRFHAAFSAGTVLSAGAGAGLSFLAVPILLHLSVFALLGFAATFWSTRGFLTAATEQQGHTHAPKSTSAWREMRTILIGVFTLVCAFTEGAANDWMSVAMVEGHHVAPWAGVLGLTAFLVMMTAGRVGGTFLLDRWGRVAVLRVLLCLGVAGSLLVIFGTTPLAFLGAALWGLGVCLGFPVGMSAAADDPRRATARMAVVSTIAYTAFIAGPPLLGFLGEYGGILRALLAVSIMLMLAILLLPVMKRPQPVAIAGITPDQRQGQG